MDCFVAFAPRNDVRTHLRVLAARYARVMPLNIHPQIRGRRECRALVRPQPRRVQNKKQAAVATVTPESPGIPRAMVLRLIARSPRGPGFFATVTRGCLRELDASVGASGPHDFAVRLRRLRQERHSASTASRPAFVTIARRPSIGTGWVERCR